MYMLCLFLSLSLFLRELKLLAVMCLSLCLSRSFSRCLSLSHAHSNARTHSLCLSHCLTCSLIISSSCVPLPPDLTMHVNEGSATRLEQFRHFFCNQTRFIVSTALHPRTSYPLLLRCHLLYGNALFYNAIGVGHGSFDVSALVSQFLGFRVLEQMHALPDNAFWCSHYAHDLCHYTAFSTVSMLPHSKVYEEVPESFNSKVFSAFAARASNGKDGVVLRPLQTFLQNALNDQRARRARKHRFPRPVPGKPCFLFCSLH